MPFPLLPLATALIGGALEGLGTASEERRKAEGQRLAKDQEHLIKQYDTDAASGNVASVESMAPHLQELGIHPSLIEAGKKRARANNPMYDMIQQAITGATGLSKGGVQPGAAGPVQPQSSTSSTPQAAPTTTQASGGILPPTGTVPTSALPSPNPDMASRQQQAFMEGYRGAPGTTESFQPDRAAATANQLYPRSAIPPPPPQQPSPAAQAAQQIPPRRAQNRVTFHRDAEGRMTASVEPGVQDPRENTFWDAFDQNVSRELQGAPGDRLQTAQKAARDAFYQTGVLPKDPHMVSLINPSNEELVVSLTHRTMTQVDQALNERLGAIQAGTPLRDVALPPNFMGQIIDRESAGLPLEKVRELKQMYAGRLAESLAPLIARDNPGLAPTLVQGRAIQLAASAMGGGNSVPDAWRQIVAGDPKAFGLNDKAAQLYLSGQYDIFAPGGIQKINDAVAETEFKQETEKRALQLIKEPEALDTFVAGRAAQQGQSALPPAVGQPGAPQPALPPPVGPSPLQAAGEQQRAIEVQQRKNVKEAEESVPNKLSGAESKDLADAETTLKNLQDIRNDIVNKFPSGIPSGPIQGGMWAWLKEKTGTMGTNETTLRTSVQHLYNSELRRLSGQAVVANEEARMKAEFPRMTDQPNIFWARLQYAIDVHETAIKVSRGVLEADALRRLADRSYIAKLFGSTREATKDPLSIKATKETSSAQPPSDVPRYYNPKTKQFEMQPGGMPSATPQPTPQAQPEATNAPQAFRQNASKADMEKFTSHIDDYKKGTITRQHLKDRLTLLFNRYGMGQQVDAALQGIDAALKGQQEQSMNPPPSRKKRG